MLSLGENMGLSEEKLAITTELVANLSSRTRRASQ